MCGDTGHEHSFQDPTAQRQEVTPVRQGSVTREKGAHKQTGDTAGPGREERAWEGARPTRLSNGP